MRLSGSGEEEGVVLIDDGVVERDPELMVVMEEDVFVRLAKW